ncbi:MAG TPA: HU family DNA-binding protein [Intrasporangiaceae bacterium]|nr:HU family DNA-binding protein [Intrasporangiaceae bacterium]
MNKSELLKALEAKLGSRKAAADALEAVVDTIIREVAKGGTVGITGFGTFEKVARAARTGRNPRTGETVRIRKTSVPKFRAGTQFKEYVAAPSKMPKSGTVGQRASATASAAPAKKAAAKKAAKSTAKSAAKTATTTKAAAKKATATKAAAKKAPAKKATTKKATARKK